MTEVCNDLGNLASHSPDGAQARLVKLLTSQDFLSFVDAFPSDSDERQQLQSALEYGVPYFTRHQRESLANKLEPLGFELVDVCSGDEREPPTTRRMGAAGAVREGRNGRSVAFRSENFRSRLKQFGAKLKKGVRRGGGDDEEVHQPRDDGRGAGRGRGRKGDGPGGDRKKGPKTKLKKKNVVDTPWTETDGSGKTGANMIEVKWTPPVSADVTEGATPKAPAQKPRSPSPARGPAGRGRDTTMPAWMTAGNAETPAMPAIADGPVAGDKEPSRSPARGRGRGRPMPSWKKQGLGAPSIPKDDAEAEDESPPKLTEAPDLLGEFFDESKGTPKRHGAAPRVELRRRSSGKGDGKRQPYARSRSRSRSASGCRGVAGGGADGNATGQQQRWSKRSGGGSSASSVPASWGHWQGGDTQSGRSATKDFSVSVFRCAVHGKKRNWDRLVSDGDEAWRCRPGDECVLYISKDGKASTAPPNGTAAATAPAKDVLATSPPPTVAPTTGGDSEKLRPERRERERGSRKCSLKRYSEVSSSKVASIAGEPIAAKAGRRDDSTAQRKSRREGGRHFSSHHRLEHRSSSKMHQLPLPPPPPSRGHPPNNDWRHLGYSPQHRGALSQAVAQNAQLQSGYFQMHQQLMHQAAVAQVSTPLPLAVSNSPHAQNAAAHRSLPPPPAPNAIAAATMDIAMEDL